MRHAHQHRREAPRGEDGEFKIRGRAEQSPAMSRKERKRKWADEDDDRRRPEGRRFESPHDDPGSNRGKRNNQTARAEDSKRPKYEHTTAGPPRTHPAPSRSTDAPLTRQPPTPRSDKGHRDKPRTREAARLAKAQESAANYPALDDKRAWQALGREANNATRDASAFVYRHLRRAKGPKALAHKEWVKCIHREMEALGLQDAWSRNRSGAEAGGSAEEKEVEEVETVAVQEEVPVVQERQYEDDGFDIDIYGDEETRAKYEPWIRSQWEKGMSVL